MKVSATRKSIGFTSGDHEEKVDSSTPPSGIMHTSTDKNPFKKAVNLPIDGTL